MCIEAGHCKCDVQCQESNTLVWCVGHSVPSSINILVATINSATSRRRHLCDSGAWSFDGAIVWTLIHDRQTANQLYLIQMSNREKKYNSRKDQWAIRKMMYHGFNNRHYHSSPDGQHSSNAQPPKERLSQLLQGSSCYHSERAAIPSQRSAPMATTQILTPTERVDFEVNARNSIQLPKSASYKF